MVFLSLYWFFQYYSQLIQLIWKKNILEFLIKENQNQTSIMLINVFNFMGSSYGGFDEIKQTSQLHKHL